MHAAKAVARAVKEQQGDVLCFLPGVGEINRTAGYLKKGGMLPRGVLVLPLHGNLSPAQQDAAIQ